MKKTAWDFGSSWESAHADRRCDESAETSCDSRYDYLGFRLASDGGFQASSGGLPKGLDRVVLSFRLALTREEPK